MCVISERKSSHKQRVIAIRCARENDCRLPRPYSFSDNYSNLIKIYPGMIVRSFAFVHLYTRNIVLELANSFGLSLKLITSWNCAHQPFSLPGFFHPRVLCHSCYFSLPVTAETLPWDYPMGGSERTRCSHILRDRFRLEAHFLFGGILPISDCFARHTTHISKTNGKECLLAEKYLIPENATNLWEIYRWVTLHWIFPLREREREREESSSSLKLSIRFSGP